MSIQHLYRAFEIVNQTTAPPTTPPAGSGGKMSNIWEKVTPNLSFLGPVLENKALSITGGVWAFAMLVCAGYCLFHWLNLAKSRNGSNPNALSSAKEGLKWSGISLIGIAGMGAVVGFAIWIAS